MGKVGPSSLSPLSLSLSLSQVRTRFRRWTPTSLPPIVGRTSRDGDCDRSQLFITKSAADYLPDKKHGEKSATKEEGEEST